MLASFYEESFNITKWYGFCSFWFMWQEFGLIFTATGFFCLFCCIHQKFLLQQVDGGKIRWAARMLESRKTAIVSYSFLYESVSELILIGIFVFFGGSIFDYVSFSRQGRELQVPLLFRKQKVPHFIDGEFWYYTTLLHSTTLHSTSLSTKLL